MVLIHPSFPRLWILLLQLTVVIVVTGRRTTTTTLFGGVFRYNGGILSTSRWGLLDLRGGGGGEEEGSTVHDIDVSTVASASSAVEEEQEEASVPIYGRISDEEYILTPEQIASFHRDGCITVENVLTEDEVDGLVAVFDRFVSGEIKVPGKDFCDMSQPFGIPYEQWNLVNCMLPTRYYPPLRNNIYERLTASMARQLFPSDDDSDDRTMIPDYDQLLNKRPGKTDAVFAWHQDMAYWPGKAALNVSMTDTCTFSLALDDSDEENGCLRYVVGSGVSKTLRPHGPLIQKGTTESGRDEGHALVTQVDESVEEIRLAPAKKGSITIHDEYVVHGSAGNRSPHRQRRTYVLAYRARAIVEAERRLGFTHSHNDEVNWDTFPDGEAHRVGAVVAKGPAEQDGNDANENA